MKKACIVFAFVFIVVLTAFITWRVTMQNLEITAKNQNTVSVTVYGFTDIYEIELEG